MAELRVLSIFGTRPEAVKMAPVIQALRRTPGVRSQVCITAQHRQMLDQVLHLFQITPDEDLDLMRPNQSLSELTASIFTHMDPVFQRLQPDWVLVLGDTQTVMAAGLAACYHRIRVGHIEAGLRTGDKSHPFPEEINRRIASVFADLHFAPTEWSRQNLLRENIPDERILVTGNPVIDALRQVAQTEPTPEVHALFEQLHLNNDPRRLVLVTAHRRENFGQPLENICSAVRELAFRFQDQAQFVYPVHLNPNVQEPVLRLLSDIPNLTLLPPLDYLPWVHLMNRADLLLTDSGGLQEEGPALGLPVLVMRDVTERPEGVEAGTLQLVGTETQRIVQAASNLLEDAQAYAAHTQRSNPYGDGHAAERIVQAILECSADRK